MVAVRLKVSAVVSRLMERVLRPTDFEAIFPDTAPGKRRYQQRYLLTEGVEGL